jgi:predicted O-methyltransferase YrrM
MTTFTHNWFPATVFDECLVPLKGQKNLRFLEVGLFEGQGTVYFFEKLLGETGTMVGIDPFIEYSKASVAKIEGFDHIINSAALGRFLDNTKPFANRIDLRRGLSQDVLPTLEAETFDMAFIDGDHSRVAVAVDARECFRLVKPGGYIVFDDYPGGDRPESSPKESIDAFLAKHSEDVKILCKAWCVVVQKLKKD